MSDHETALIRRKIVLRGDSYITNDNGDILLRSDGTGTMGGGGGSTINGLGLEFGSVLANTSGTAVTFPSFANKNYFFVCSGIKDKGMVLVPYGEVSDGTKLENQIMVYPEADGTTVTWCAIGAMPA